MAFVLWLEKRKMPTKTKEKFQLAEQGKAQIIIPAFVFVELAYLSENNRINTTIHEAQYAVDTNKNIVEYPLSLETVKTAFEIDDIPELHDRLIAATAKHLSIEIITNDPEIEKSAHVRTVWR